MLGLRFSARAFSSCGKRGPLFIAVRGPLTIAASLVAEHRLQTRRLSSCGSRAQPLRGMWDLPRPGREPVSPALAGRLPTTAPPGKPNVPSWFYLFIYLFFFSSRRRHTRYIGDWSSDVCSSDLASHYRSLTCCGAQAPDAQAQQLWLTGLVAPRSEERRVGKECRSRWSPYH